MDQSIFKHLLMTFLDREGGGLIVFWGDPRVGALESSHGVMSLMTWLKRMCKSTMKNMTGQV